MECDAMTGWLQMRRNITSRALGNSTANNLLRQTLQTMRMLNCLTQSAYANQNAVTQHLQFIGPHTPSMSCTRDRRQAALLVPL